MSRLLYQCVTKATTDEGEQIRHSWNWVVARRAILRVTSDAFECADWKIPYCEIDDAVLFSTRQLLIPGYVLRVRSAGKIYQFGLNPGRYWKGELPFPVRREKAKLGYSRSSLITRVFLLFGFVLWLIGKFLR